VIIRLSLAASVLLLPGCFTEQPAGEYDLNLSPFANSYVGRDTATMEIVVLPGYTCPDGSSPRVYYVEPVGVVGPRPLGVVIPGGNFDYVEENIREDHYAGENRLAASWGNREAERILGLVESDVNQDIDGAWTAAFLQAGFSVIVPSNCWGDLWHGTGDGDWSGEGFLRQGGYFLDDAINSTQRREDIEATHTVVVGLSEGGRGVTELALGLAGSSRVPSAAVAVDSSPDWLAGVLLAPAANADRIDGYERIYEAELTDDGDNQIRQDELRDALERDSLATVVEAGWRTPIIYSWSSDDDTVDSAWSEPAALAISTLYDPADQIVQNWGLREHAPSNRDLSVATTQVDWLRTHLP
jgi:hypothetical protein